MRFPRRFLVHCGVLLAAAMLAACGGKSQAPEEAGRAFLEQISAGKFDEAYAQTAYAFRLKQDLEHFTGSARDYRIPGCTVTEVSTRKAEKDEAAVEVTLKTPKEVRPIKLVLDLVRQDGRWQVLTIRSPRDLQTGVSEDRFTTLGGAVPFAEAARHELPTEAEAKKLVRNVVASFSQAAQSGNFAPFYKSLSGLAQSRVSEKRLAESFQGFVQRAAELKGVEQVEPLLTESPYLNTAGMTVVTGKFDRVPEVLFTMIFVYELPRWKLMDLNLQMANAPAK